MHGDDLDDGLDQRQRRHVVSLQEGDRPLRSLHVVEDLQQLGHGQNAAFSGESCQSRNIIKTTYRQRPLRCDELYRFCGFLLFFPYDTRIADRLKLRYDISRHFGARPVS